MSMGICVAFKMPWPVRVMGFALVLGKFSTTAPGGATVSEPLPPPMVRLLMLYTPGAKTSGPLRLILPYVPGTAGFPGCGLFAVGRGVGSGGVGNVKGPDAWGTLLG